jgi:thiamine-monophosphate kinase
MNLTWVMPAEGDVGGLSEIALVERIAARATLRPGVAVGIGDDAAVLEGEPAIVLTQDLLVEGVHFRRGLSARADVGHKALAVNLSDLAAMGAGPVACLVGLGTPATGGPDAEEVDEIYRGMDALAERHGCTVAGGDTTQAPVLLLSVTALGRMEAGVAPVLRGGAGAGDVLCVTGPLGAAAAGLLVLEEPLLATGVAEAAELRRAHLRPEPRLDAGRALARGVATAMLDCSDGLALDALRLARASGLAATIDLERVPVAAGVARVAAAAGLEADVLAATGGEDYELIAAVPPDRLAARPDLIAVGVLEPGEPGITLRRRGRELALPRLGWEHLG